jgi:hypothetical protein
VHLEPGGDVVTDRHGGEGGRALEDHADVPAHGDGVDPGGVDVAAVEDHLTPDAGRGHRLVHPVQAPEERRLPASRRPDDRSHLAVPELDRDAAHGTRRAEEGVEITRDQAGGARTIGLPHIRGELGGGSASHRRRRIGLA